MQMLQKHCTQILIGIFMAAFVIVPFVPLYKDDRRFKVLVRFAVNNACSVEATLLQDPSQLKSLHYHSVVNERRCRSECMVKQRRS